MDAGVADTRPVAPRLAGACLGDIALTQIVIASPFAHPIEKFRRALLGLSAALIAAQPAAIGSPVDGPPAPFAGVVLTLGWFLVFAGWSAWHALARPGRRIGGWVALALLMTAAVVATRSAMGTPNAWRAILTTWQWIAIPCAFISVRQLAATSDDSRGLFAVVVATAVGIAGAHVAPLVSGVFGVAWPSEFPVSNWQPVDFEFPGAVGIGAAGQELRWWSNDLFWIALALPACIIFGWRSRAAPFPRDRMLAWAPLAILLVGTAARAIHQWPPAPVSWTPAIRMAASSPGGVGPGSYDRFVARFTNSESDIVRIDPPNSYLSVAAASGWAALATLAVTLAVLIWFLKKPRKLPTDAPVRVIRPHWEMHIGGVIGILAGMGLEAYDWPGVSAPPIVALSTIAIFRILAWFPTFAVAENCLLMEESDNAPAIGLIAVLCCAAAYDLLRPGLSFVFWVTAAIGVNLASPPAISTWAASLPGRLLPLLVAPVLLAGYVVSAFVPAMFATSGAHRAIRATPIYDAKLDVIHRADGPAARSASRGEGVRYIRRLILQPLIDAEADTGGWTMGPAADLAAIRAPWWAASWDLGATGDADQQAILDARTAQSLDPENVAGYLAEMQSRLRFAAHSPIKRAEQLAIAESLVSEVLRRDPALEARLRFRIAAANFAAKDSAAGAREARAAISLDAQAPGPRYRLTEAERDQIRRWLVDNEKK